MSANKGKALTPADIAKRFDDGLKAGKVFYLKGGKKLKPEAKADKGATVVAPTAKLDKAAESK